jgi:hypothetical protein
MSKERFVEQWLLTTPNVNVYEEQVSRGLVIEVCAPPDSFVRVHYLPVDSLPIDLNVSWVYFQRIFDVMVH